ncbi:hypothetical protein A0J57_04040 [Sphingobium sp. 22B]|uniref:glutathione S-transferase family protein n=1 Tax=unclassified Sphingobium TaxID=2611147 RepID=UPI0007804AC3|nr:MULTISPECIES: glutathione S-transferase family protein [unclassified Sphingobium]KXU33820.1 hypothetical protein AXW74_00590 [Sphingobium sp. AM]KYC33764.1 hypothetical protein A0J57_04040 [Sphingobium sp. 22B]OAP33502.1 hypothetical protein A8O16_03260 [Sphingobium sp. 20006FA]
MVIDLYGMSSPNVLKVAIMLEEVGCPYEFHHVDVLRGGGSTPEFLAMNPLGKVPVIVDHDGAGADHPIFESVAILIYLAETYGSPLLPPAPARWDVMKWLVAQAALAGPMLGQMNHFQLVADHGDSYAAGRYRDQAARVYANFNTRLSVSPWLGGDSYSIADIAMYPWSAYLERHGFSAEDHPYLVAWRNRIDERPAVKRGVRTVTSRIDAEAASVQAASDSDYDRFFGRSGPSGVSVDMASYAARGAFMSAKV